MSNQSPYCRHSAPVQQTNTIGLVFRRYSEAYIDQYQPDLPKINLLKNIRKCRTPALGALVIVCKGCGEAKLIYKSCGDSKCPICQGIKRMQAQDKISNQLLAVPYIHTIFTLPHELNLLLKRNQKLLYGLLYQSAWKTIKKLCGDASNVGGLPGMIALMHTWGSDMKYHVHLHTLITFGGLDKEGNWQYPKRASKIARYREINNTFRDIYLDGLNKLLQSGVLNTVPFIENLLAEVSKKSWVVHNTAPQLDTKVMEEYLSRYIMKIAISNSRISFDEAKEQVALIYNDYSRQEDGKAAPKAQKILDPLSFIHQFLQHLPPKNFQRIRYYGLHAPITYKRIKDQIPDKLKRVGSTVRTVLQIVRAMLGVDTIACETCEGSDFEQEILPPDYEWLSNHIRGYSQRAPPNALSYLPPREAGSQMVNGDTMPLVAQNPIIVQ